MLRKPASLALLGTGVLLFGAQMALAQPDAEDRTVERAGHIATQPVRDVGLSKEKIALVLQAAVEDTYALPKNRCRALVEELAELNEALGPDFDAEPVKGDDKVTRLAEAGGEMVVNSLIPFRGLVREVTGAASADRRRLAAVNAGLARRGFLRGLAQERRCKLPAPPKVPAKSPEE